jgi:DDE superfamily endonuclease
MIFKGKDVQTSWFYTEVEQDWLYITLENGWTSNNIGLSWLKELFLIESAIDDPLQTRILVLNGHESHIPTNFIYECEIHNVKLFYLSAHSSHVTQPLNLSIFSPVKHHYRKEIDTIAAYDHRHFETPLMRAQSDSGELRVEGTWLSKLKGRNIV